MLAECRMQSVPLVSLTDGFEFGEITFVTSNKLIISLRMEAGGWLEFEKLVAGNKTKRN